MPMLDPFGPDADTDAEASGETEQDPPAIESPADPSEAVGGCPGEAVTGKDGLRTQISTKFVSSSFQVETPVDDPAVQGVSLARLANQQYRLGVRYFVFDLHCTVLVARGDNRRTPIPQVGKERPRVRG
jgi:hypothetical protein